MTITFIVLLLQSYKQVIHAPEDNEIVFQILDSLCGPEDVCPIDVCACYVEDEYATC